MLTSVADAVLHVGSEIRDEIHNIASKNSSASSWSFETRSSNVFGIKHSDTATKMRSEWSSRRRTLSRAIESKAFEFTMAFVMVVYVFFVILDTDRRASRNGIPNWLRASMLSMLFVYVVDVSVRLFVYRRLFFSNPWNTFDLTVVSSDILAEFLAMYNIDIGVSISVLRILRLGRLMRFMQVLSIFQELYVMLSLMMSALRAIGWGALLMVMMLTMWSIIAVEVLHPLNVEIAETTDAYEGCDRCARAFESVMQSNLTFFQQIIAGDAWGTINVVMIENHPGSALLLVTVLITINLGLMNLVITVIVDSSQTSREQNVKGQLLEKQRLFEEAKLSFVALCERLDEDGSGHITMSELLTGYERVPAFADTLTLMDVRKEDMGLVFRILDKDRSGAVSYDEFAEQLFRMKAQDSHMMQVFTKAYVREIYDHMTAKFASLQDSLELKLGTVEERVRQAGENSYPAIHPPSPTAFVRHPSKPVGVTCARFEDKLSRSGQFDLPRIEVTDTVSMSTAHAPANNLSSRVIGAMASTPKKATSGKLLRLDDDLQLATDSDHMEEGSGQEEQQRREHELQDKPQGTSLESKVVVTEQPASSTVQESRRRIVTA